MSENVETQQPAADTQATPEGEARPDHSGWFGGGDAQERLIRYILGATGLGLGAASGVGLFNMFRESLNRRDKKETDADDNILYVDVPEGHPRLESKIANEQEDYTMMDAGGDFLKDVGSGAMEATGNVAEDLWEGLKYHAKEFKKDQQRPAKPGPLMSGPEMALAILAAGGTAAGSYMLVRKLLQERRRKDLQAELDASQRSYLSGGSEKLAGRGVGRTIADVGWLVAALTALAGGVGAYKTLDYHFPKPERKGEEEKKKYYPKKVVFRSKKTGEDEPDKIDEDDGDTPDYSYSTQDRVVAASVDETRELLLRTIVGSEKQASESGFKDLITAVGNGYGDELPLEVNEMMSKAASLVQEHNLESKNEDAAITYLATDEGKGTALDPILAAEYADMSPHYMKMASGVPADQIPVLEGIIHHTIKDIRSETFKPLVTDEIIKSASENKQEEEFAYSDYLATVHTMSKQLLKS
jgi:hypothetical protein